MAVQAVAYAALAGLQLLSSVQQANNIQKQAELQKKLDEFNMDQIQLDAFLAEQEGYTQKARYQSVIDQTLAAQTVAYRAENIDPNFGSVKDIQNESKLNADLNLISIQTNAHMRALGYQKQLNDMRTQSKLNVIGAENQAINIRNAGILNAAGTALKGAESSGMFSKSSGTGYEKPPIQFGAPLKTGGADNFNYSAYYGWAPGERA